MYLKHYHIYIIMLTLSQTFHRRFNVSHLGHIFTIHRAIYMFPQKKTETKLEKKNKICTKNDDLPN